MNCLGKSKRLFITAASAGFVGETGKGNGPANSPGQPGSVHGNTGGVKPQSLAVVYL